MTALSLPADGFAAQAEHSAPDLSIVVVTHNGRELALETLASAMASLGGVSVEWVIVDSGSSDDTPDAIEARWPEIEVMRMANVGFAAANNAGFGVARGRYLLALNPDTVVRWGRFRALVDAMDERPEIGAASVIQEEADGSLQSIRRDPTVTRALSEALLLRKLPGCDHLQERELDQARIRRGARGRLARRRGADSPPGGRRGRRRLRRALLHVLRGGGPVPSRPRCRLGGPSSAGDADPPLRGQAQPAAGGPGLVLPHGVRGQALRARSRRWSTAACWPCTTPCASPAWRCARVRASGARTSCAP